MPSRREINEYASRAVPSHAWESTVAIVIAHDGDVHQFGSGILFRIADSSFVVTAAHVIKQAAEHKKTLGISSARNFIAVTGKWLCSSEGQYGSNEDPLDIAVHQLADDAVHRLAGKVFLRFDDIEFAEQSPTAVYSLFGFPTVWSQLSPADPMVLEVKALQYTTFRYDRDVSDFGEYQERLHLLLDAQFPCTDDSGEVVTFRNMSGASEPFPGRLGGISGCSVWRIGDLRTPMQSWSHRPARIVGVQTGVYSQQKAIKATRWVAVSTLLHDAFPDLRPAFTLLRA